MSIFTRPPRRPKRARKRNCTTFGYSHWPVPTTISAYLSLSLPTRTHTRHTSQTTRMIRASLGSTHQSPGLSPWPRQTRINAANTLLINHQTDRPPLGLPLAQFALAQHPHQTGHHHSSEESTTCLYSDRSHTLSHATGPGGSYQSTSTAPFTISGQHGTLVGRSVRALIVALCQVVAADDA